MKGEYLRGGEVECSLCGNMQISRQHVAPCVKWVEWELDTRCLNYMQILHITQCQILYSQTFLYVYIKTEQISVLSFYRNTNL